MLPGPVTASASGCFVAASESRNSTAVIPVYSGLIGVSDDRTLDHAPSAPITSSARTVLPSANSISCPDSTGCMLTTLRPHWMVPGSRASTNIWRSTFRSTSGRPLPPSRSL